MSKNTFHKYLKVTIVVLALISAGIRVYDAVVEALEEEKDSCLTA